MPRLLLVDDDPTAATRMLPPLESQGYITTYSPCGDPAVSTLQERDFDVVLLCACYTGPKGLYVLSRARALQLDAQFIVLTDDKSIETATSDKYDRIIELLNVNEGHRVLDVGSGLGDFLAHLEQRDIEAVGLTISPDQQRICNRRGLDVRLWNP